MRSSRSLATSIASSTRPSCSPPCRALHVLTDAALCGPVTLALPQDVQTMAWDYPSDFFAPRVAAFPAPAASDDELDAALARLRRASRPMIVAGGGVLYSRGGPEALSAFAWRH